MSATLAYENGFMRCNSCSSCFPTIGGQKSAHQHIKICKQGKMNIDYVSIRRKLFPNDNIDMDVD